MSIRHAIEAYVAKAIEHVDDDDLTCAGEDAAKVARILSDVAINLATLDAKSTTDDPAFVGPGDVVIDHEGFVWRFDGDVEWDIVDYVGDDPEIQARFEGCDDPTCPCHDTGPCDDPECLCNATCDDCGADLSPGPDDVIATLRVTDHGALVNVEGLCDEHAESLVTDLFELAHRHFGGDEDSLVSVAASDVVIRVDGPVI